MGAPRREHRRVGPISLRHDVVQRRVRRLHPPRMQACGHRLNALAVARQQQSRTIRMERRGTIGIAKCRRDRLDIGGEPCCAAARAGFETHNPPPRVRISNIAKPASNRTRIL